MLIGSLSDVDSFNKLDQASRDAALQAALDAFRTNPVIDQEIQKNPVIMRELATSVNATFNPTKALAANFQVKTS